LLNDFAGRFWICIWWGIWVLGYGCISDSCTQAPQDGPSEARVAGGGGCMGGCRSDCGPLARLAPFRAPRLGVLVRCVQRDACAGGAAGAPDELRYATRQRRACATAAAKPTWERSVEIMKDRASSMERAPSNQASATDAGLTTTQPEQGGPPWTPRKRYCRRPSRDKYR
jgi:hypothetical protein